MRIKQWLRNRTKQGKKKTNNQKTKPENKKVKSQNKLVLFKALQKQFHLWELIVNCLLQVLILKGTHWGCQALMPWRGRQIFSQPKHPDLSVDATCFQRYLHPICFCGGRIPLVLEVKVEEEASLAQLWEHTKSQYVQTNLWIKSLVPSVYDCVTGTKKVVCISPGLGRKHLSVITKILFKRENVLPSWIRLDGPDCVWVRLHHLELCLTWFPSASVLWFLVCLLSSICREKSSLQQGLETINKNSNLKCWSSPLGEAQWWEEEELLAGVICSAGRILECNHIIQQA